MMCSHLFAIRVNIRWIYGMNFHYLPPMLRFRLLERMQATMTDSRFDSKTKFDVNYDDVKVLRL